MDKTITLTMEEQQTIELALGVLLGRLGWGFQPQTFALVKSIMDKLGKEETDEQHA